jgi:hypothetical protein
MKDKEFYREEIIRTVNSINRQDVLEYLYVFITERLKGVDLNSTKESEVTR